MAEFCIHEKHGGFCEKTDAYCNLGACPYEDLKEHAPVRHGRWIFHEDDYWDYVECSECHDEFTSFEGDCAVTNYCPSCGADMRERKSK